MLACLVLLAVLDPAGAMPASLFHNRTEMDPAIVELRAAQARAFSCGDRALARELEARVQGRLLELQGRTEPVVLHDLIVPAAPGSGGEAGPDVLVRSGRIGALAVDYQMDGTMWVASSNLDDSFYTVHKSTDHGESWQQVIRFNSWVCRKDRIGLVVGEGESAFVHIFLISTMQSGNLYLSRYTLDGQHHTEFEVLVGPEVVNDLLVCRDYSGDDYWLYAIAGDDQNINYDEPFARSTDYGRTWAVLDTFRYAMGGHLAAGAGSWLYVTYGTYAPWEGRINVATNSAWGGSLWHYIYFEPDDYQAANPVIAPAFTLPESSATAWVVYSHNYQNSGDWDVMVSYSTGRGVGWTPPQYLGGSSTALEFFADVKNYTSEGNPYVNASYVSEESGVRRVYRQYASAGSPGTWSDTLRINEHSAATGAEVRPRLAYSPGSAGTGAGCVFAGAGLDNLYWNAPWHVTGVETPRGPAARPGVLAVKPNPCRDRLTVQLPAGARTVRISDATGRIVLSAVVPAGPSFAWDPGAAPAGVYFVAVDAGQGRSTATFVKQ